MKKLSRDTKLALGILVLLVIVTIFAATQKKDEQQYPVLSTESPKPDGALALKLWVQELDYKVDDQVLTSFIPPKNAAIIFMLEPQFPTEDELEALDKWVEAGGTVIAAGSQYGMYSLIDHYEFEFSYLSDPNLTPVSETPLFDSPSVLDLKNASVRVGLRSERDDYVTLASYQGQPVLVSFEQGNGRVILSTLTESFTNAGLKEAGNPELVLNILALAQKKGTIWFNEWHHGVRGGSEILGPAEFLRRTPVGRSIAFTALVIFAVLLIQGRGFGRPVPLPQEIKRRTAMEHITGVANLSRRAAHRSAVMMHYHQQIKRKLGQRYRLNPSLDDGEYVDILSGYNTSINKEELLSATEGLISLWSN